MARLVPGLWTTKSNKNTYFLAGRFNSLHIEFVKYFTVIILQKILFVPQSNAWVLQQYAIVSGNLLFEVGEQRYMNAAQASGLQDKCQHHHNNSLMLRQYVTYCTRHTVLIKWYFPLPNARFCRGIGCSKGCRKPVFFNIVIQYIT